MYFLIPFPFPHMLIVDGIHSLDKKLVMSRYIQTKQKQETTDEIPLYLFS